MKLVGIDPGQSGGIAYQDNEGGVHLMPMMETEGDIKDALFKLTFSGNPVVFMERAPSAMPGKVSGLAKLNANAGFIRGVLMARGVRLEIIQPKKWQEPLNLGTRSACKDDNEWKRKLKAKAQQLFPHTDGITLKTADALLILNYAITNK